ncbi:MULTISPECIES: aldo/keto reductase [Glutamicibacter]|uniref:aldo/keto reductase n=1 Tax=Glutamicibacter TaxID=1742989 RepID=UPI0011F16599|nr:MULTISPECIES: aldo/keto reductase [Glutamicibacter]QEP07319.1 aldo/keto reductase [Glutamicibacter sp. ZJUTW]WIV42442.1 aldo/keto reductase [Glutamicibacter nicotianae]
MIADISSFELAGGVSMPSVGLGTWPLRGQEAVAAVRSALDVGYRRVDTAENYENEDAVGQALAQSRLDRDEFFVTTKFNKKWHSALGVRQALENSLSRLGLDYVDLFLIHWPNPRQNTYVEAFTELAKLVDEGKIRAAGVSNFKPYQLQKILEAGHVPALNQIQVDPERQSAEWQTFNTEHGVRTEAYSPLGRQKSDFLSHPTLAQISEAHGKSSAQVTLRWHVQSGRAAAPKSADPQRQRENLDIFDFHLTQAEIAAIDAMDTGAGPFTDSDEFGH